MKPLHQQRLDKGCVTKMLRGGDRSGTMPIIRPDVTQTSFERKMLAYLMAYAARHHEQQFGWKIFRVLTVTPDVRRLASIVETLRGFGPLSPPGSALFWFAVRDDLRRSNPVAYLWHDGTGLGRQLV
jgi:hypothetical protein